MDKQQAQQLLGLTDSATIADINAAFTAKLDKNQSKVDSAPTEALKQKLLQMQTPIKEAHQTLLSDAQAKASTATPPQATPSNSSPLSQTKMADLPGMSSSQAEGISLQTGQTLANRYQIKELIAQGGMGAVYRAFDTNRNEDIAIKVMLPQLMKNDTARERFLDEARLSSQLSHPNIVNVYDVQQTEGFAFLTMELLEGQDLRALMEGRKIVRQTFSLSDVVEILTPICMALDHAHEVTIHRDIKPENIYLTDEGKYKLMDFGIARLMSTSQRSQSGATTGTAYYMAPEQLKGVKDIDGRADQYALAVLAYELLSGEVPAGAIEPLHQLNKSISKKVSEAVQKALSPKPENRHESLNGFLVALKSKGGINTPSLPIKPIGIASAVIIALFLLMNNGGSIWDVIKPIDRELLEEIHARLQLSWIQCRRSEAQPRSKSSRYWSWNVG